MAETTSCTNVFSELHPTWVQYEEGIEYDDFWTIIQFYVVYSLCDGQSWKDRSLQEPYRWKKNPWNPSSYLKDRILRAIWPNGEARLSMAENKESYERVINGKGLDESFITDTHNQRACYVKVANGNGNGNLIMSFLYHVRNGLAHGRFCVVSVSDTDQMIFLEDGKPHNQRFEVTARIAILKSSLLMIKEIIENGPDDEYEYSDEILQEICHGNNTKKGIMEITGIQENIWRREIEKLKLNGRVTYVNKKWCAVSTQ